jgi:Carboxypeptidase regulatory-like domain/TonB-dependent Receptor Plug Domain/TonB dependent receptor
MKTKSLRHQFVVSTMFMLALTGKAFAQTPGTGAISGVVYDPSDRVIANAEVLAANEATHVSRSVVTTAEGVFHVPLLPPGIYSVTVTAGGFAKQTFPSIPVTVSETSSLNVTLTIPGVSASVRVVSDAKMAETESSTLGRAVGQESIQDLPLANRNYTQILGLSPGVVVALPDATALGRDSQNVTSNGAKTTSNNIQFNGIDANNLSQNSAANDGEEVGTAVPAPDAIQEFKVQTANYDASYGRGAGANVDFVSKSGTNRFHGTTWEFVRNNILNANDFFSKLDAQPRPTLKQNEFGASFGGPIRGDKTFFFIEYQGITAINGEGDKVTTTLPQVTSDRSAATLGAQFCPANQTNAAGYLTNAGGTQVACDGSNINPVALALLNFKLGSGQYAIPNPQVNLPAISGQLPVGQSTFAPPAKYRENQFSVNMDQVINAKNTLSGRFFYSRAPTIEPFSPNAANVPGWGTNELDQNTMFVLADTHVFNSNLINLARFGYMRFNGLSAVANPILASDAGMSTPTGIAGVAPGVSINGLFTTGDAGTPSQWQNTNSFIWQDTISRTRNRNNMRIGVEMKRHEVDVDAPFSTDGLLQISTFDDFLLGQSAAQNGSPIGLSNVTDSMGSSGLFRKDERYTDLAAFIQDDIKLTQRLTVNAGLRYEIFGPPVEIHGLLPSFDPAVAVGQVPVTGSLSGYTLPGNFPGPVPTGVTKTSTNGLWATDFHNVSPRLGFALELTRNPTVLLRGGYGIYYDRPSGDFAEGQLGQQPFSLQQLSFDAQNAGATLQNPFDPLLPLTSSFPIYQPRIAGGGAFTSGVSPRVIDPYTQEYNLNVQYALARNFLLEVGYVGTHTTHSPGSLEFNQALLASAQNPVNGTSMNTAANVIQRLPFAGIATGSLFSNTEFESNYNSLQASINKRLGHGLQFLGSYTWSKILDETSGSGGSNVFELWLLTNNQNNPRQAYGLTDFDRDQRAVVNFTWSAPKFRQGPMLARQALSDWEFSGISVIQSGSPITVLDSNAGLVYGNFENRAQRTGLNPSTHGSLHSRVLNGYLDPSAFTLAPEAPNGSGPGDTDFGNSGVGIVRGPGQHNIDMAVERIFPVTESSSFRFRAEFFNLTNTPQFANPNNSLDFTAGPSGPVNLNPSFGMITSTAANPRIIQFAVKYLF